MKSLTLFNDVTNLSTMTSYLVQRGHVVHHVVHHVFTTCSPHIVSVDIGVFYFQTDAIQMAAKSFTAAQVSDVIVAGLVTS